MIDRSQEAAWQAMQDAAARRRDDDTLPKGSGGGTFDGMEPRVAKLEAHMEHVKADLAKLSGLPVEIATLKTKVDHLPGKGFIVTAAGSTIVLVTGLLVLLQKVGVLH